MEKLSVCVTTFNNQRTLEALLRSVAWADEVVVLDSFSTDRTPEIARAFGARLLQQPFAGYGPQKQRAIDLASHRWVLLLDADEAVSPELAAEIQALLRRGPDCDAYEIPRLEQLFWRMIHPRTRMNHFLRLFDRTRTRMSTMPIHAAPKTEGRVGRLKAPFYHFGEVSVHHKVERINHYSSGLVADKVAKGRRPSPWVMVLYPPLYFLRLYLFKRNFLNGWPGFMTSFLGACYAFLKYAKVYEHHQRARLGDSLLPPGAPPSFLPGQGPHGPEAPACEGPADAGRAEGGSGPG